jgi:chromosome segregation ATPase
MFGLTKRSPSTGDALQHRVRELEDLLAASEEARRSLQQAVASQDDQIAELTANLDEVIKIIEQRDEEIDQLKLPRSPSSKNVATLESQLAETLDLLHSKSAELVASKNKETGSSLQLDLNAAQAQLVEVIELLELRDQEISDLKRELTQKKSSFAPAAVTTADTLAAAELSSNLEEALSLLEERDEEIAQLREKCSQAVPQAALIAAESQVEELTKILEHCDDEIEKLKAAATIPSPDLSAISSLEQQVEEALTLLETKDDEIAELKKNVDVAASAQAQAQSNNVNDLEAQLEEALALLESKDTEITHLVTKITNSKEHKLQLEIYLKAAQEQISELNSALKISVQTPLVTDLEAKLDEALSLLETKDDEIQELKAKAETEDTKITRLELIASTAQLEDALTLLATKDAEIFSLQSSKTKGKEIRLKLESQLAEADGKLAAYKDAHADTRQLPVVTVSELEVKLAAAAELLHARDDEISELKAKGSQADVDLMSRNAVNVFAPSAKANQTSVKELRKHITAIINENKALREFVTLQVEPITTLAISEDFADLKVFAQVTARLDRADKAAADTYKLLHVLEEIKELVHKLENSGTKTGAGKISTKSMSIPEPHRGLQTTLSAVDALIKDLKTPITSGVDDEAKELASLRVELQEMKQQVDDYEAIIIELEAEKVATRASIETVPKLVANLRTVRYSEIKVPAVVTAPAGAPDRRSSTRSEIVSSLGSSPAHAQRVRHEELLRRASDLQRSLLQRSLEN